MTRIEGELRCVPGHMTLSKTMEKALVARFGDRVSSAAPLPKFRGQWFCPACRVPLGQDMSCPKCRGTVHDLLFQLVDGHPHKRAG